MGGRDGEKERMRDRESETETENGQKSGVRREDAASAVTRFVRMNGCSGKTTICCACSFENPSLLF